MDRTDAGTVSQWGLLYSRWTGRMQGQYPKGVCYIVDGQGGCRGSIPRGVCCMVMDRTEAGAVSQGGLLYGHGPDGGRGSIPRGSAKWSMDRTEEGQYTTDIWAERMGQYTTWCLNNGQWNHWMLWLAVLNTQTNWFLTRIPRVLGKR